MAFSRDDLAINPYKDSSSVVFISSFRDTIRLKGSRHTGNMTVQENGFNSDLWVYDHCKGRWYDSQFDWTWFYDLSPGSPQIEIELALPLLFNSSSPGKTISFACSVPDTSFGTFKGTYQYDKDSIWSLTPSHYNGFVEGYQTSLVLGPKTYFDVYKLHSDTTDNSMYIIPDWIDRVYYSVSDGIVGFSLKSGKYYYLEKKF